MLASSKVNKVTVASNTDHFKGFEDLISIMSEKKFIRSTSVYCEGDSLRHLYYVKEGVVKLSKVSDDGKDLILHYFYPGDLFGEYYGAEAHMATFSAEAVKDCKIGLLNLDDLNDLLSHNGELGLNFSKWLSQMQWFTQIKLRDILFHGKNGALASTLIRAANTYGITQGDSIIITQKLTNYELANLIGATRETVNRMLNQFQKDHLIDVKNGRITIVDLQGLKRICHCEECPIGICRL